MFWLISFWFTRFTILPIDWASIREFFVELYVLLSLWTAAHSPWKLPNKIILYATSTLIPSIFFCMKWTNVFTRDYQQLSLIRFAFGLYMDSRLHKYTLNCSDYVNESQLWALSKASLICLFFGESQIECN